MIYLDNAGTTAVYPRVADMIKTYLTTDFFNASATYKPALAIRSAIDLSRAKIARFFRRRRWRNILHVLCDGIKQLGDKKRMPQ